MATWMVLALAPGLALCCAALLAEQGARRQRWPGRWIWLAAMAGSIVLPMFEPAIPQLAPFHLPAAVHAPMSASPAIVPRQAGAVAPNSGAPLARGLWIALSALTLLAFIGAAQVLRRRARSWRRLSLAGTEVYVAPDAGPAVFGWWRPRIVLPAWLVDAPGRQRALAMAHEQSHVAARDPQLLGVALALTVLMPWNPSLWWQLRRLRQAIEVDCDARVLGRGCDLVDYGETLLALGLRRASLRGLMAAGDQSQSLLERRIRIMSTQPNRWSRLAACALTGLALCVAAVAAELSPAHTAPAATSPRVAAPMAVAPIPAVPAIPAVPPVPAAPHVLPVAPPAPVAFVPPPPPDTADASDTADSESDAGQTAMEAAREAAQEASERAAELKSNAEEIEKAAQEAKRDAEEQLAQARDAMREAQAAEAEAQQRMKEALEAERAARASKQVN